jgi:hypothetical protein
VTVNVATVGPVATRLVLRILRCSLRLDVWIEGNSNRTEAIGAGRASLSHRYMEPVAVVLDADTLEEGPLHEQRSTVEYLLKTGVSDDRFRLVLAVPQVEAVLFSDRTGLERALGRKIADDDFFEARFRPKAVFQRLVGRRDTERRALAVIDALDEAALRCMAKHPIIHEIAEFVEEVSASGEQAQPAARAAG